MAAECTRDDARHVDIVVRLPLLRESTAWSVLTLREPAAVTPTARLWRDDPAGRLEAFATREILRAMIDYGPALGLGDEQLLQVVVTPHLPATQGYLDRNTVHTVSGWVLAELGAGDITPDDVIGKIKVRQIRVRAR